MTFSWHRKAEEDDIRRLFLLLALKACIDVHIHTTWTTELHMYIPIHNSFIYTLMHSYTHWQKHMCAGTRMHRFAHWESHEPLYPAAFCLPWVWMRFLYEVEFSGSLLIPTCTLLSSILFLDLQVSVFPRNLLPGVWTSSQGWPETTYSIPFTSLPLSEFLFMERLFLFCFVFLAF